MSEDREGGGPHPRTLARQFAAALVHLRDTWDVQYWPTSASPPLARAPAPGPTSVAPPAPDVPRESVAQPAALREQARNWSPATKLEYLRRRNVGDCQRCGLAKTRTHIVFGVGNPEATIVFVGEAPGADEDRQGEPFVGRAGKRLDAWLADVGLARDDVYIANVLKCRPPGNRDPRPDEVDKCSPFLQAQIRAIAPRVIVALGRHAGMLLSRREDLSLGRMRATRLHYEIASSDGTAPMRIPLIVTYHPAYVLRQEDGGESGRSSAEETALADLRRALELCA
ncbi:MAG TPA: uracil-DNA glycosylase [Nannocystaceae bacterium]|nr:uracil-DNA glycosylase [Nannocystaceae bacterium]